MEYTIDTEIGNYKIVDIFEDKKHNKVLTLKCLKCNTPAKFYSKIEEFDPNVECPCCRKISNDIPTGTKIDFLLILGRLLHKHTPDEVLEILRNQKVTNSD